MSQELNGIGQPVNNATLWRYMSFEKFANILVTESLFFTRADGYDDKFEGYVPESTKLSYESAISGIDLNNFRQYIMCNCWHQGIEESMAMWDKYHLRSNGIAIKTTMGNLKNSLPDKPNVFIGGIEYIENHNQIEMPENPSIESLVHSPYFYKRNPFRYEQEVRAIIDVLSILHDDPHEFGIPLEIEVKTLINKNSEIIVSPHADEWVTKTVRLIVERCGFEFPVNGSKLLDPPS